MEKLEKTLQKVSVNHAEKTTLKKEENLPLYDGLQLVEDKPYKGPTSVMYWM